MEIAFRRYRIMSFITGSTLLTLFVFLLLHWIDLSLWKHLEILVRIDGIAHGIIMYPLYMIASFNMVLKFRLPLALLLLMLVAGFLPGVAFYLESRMRLRLYPGGLPAK
jgi:integral membrane protein